MVTEKLCSSLTMFNVFMKNSIKGHPAPHALSIIFQVI